jgi:hypothetical protein
VSFMLSRFSLVIGRFGKAEMGTSEASTTPKDDHEDSGALLASSGFLPLTSSEFLSLLNSDA